jgi:hypothetical protein
VAATGDFVMVSEEVDRVTKALTEHGILITALHNHLVHGSLEFTGVVLHAFLGGR